MTTIHHEAIITNYLRALANARQARQRRDRRQRDRRHQPAGIASVPGLNRRRTERRRGDRRRTPSR